MPPPTRPAIEEVRVSPWVSTIGRKPWVGSGIEAYRVWVWFDGICWWQRHEWKCDDPARSHCEDWIRSLTWFPSHYTKVPRSECPWLDQRT